jgi:CRISPR-associated protein Csy2
MSDHYLLLPRLEVRTANAQSTWWLINAAPVVAANLFAHNLGRKTGILPRRVGILHHDAQLLGEVFYREFRPQQRRGAVYINGDDYSSKNKHALSLQPTATCHLNLSLVLVFDAVDGPPSVPEVEAFLGGARLAGGQIVRFGASKSAGSLSELRQALPAGYWIVERPDLMSAPDPSTDSLDALIAACSLPRRRRPETSSNAEPTSRPESWIVPTTLGYALLNEATDRPGARDGYLHAYAEPLVGLVQYLSLRHLADQALPFWRTVWPRDDVFLVTQQEG